MFFYWQDKSFIASAAMFSNIIKFPPFFRRGFQENSDNFHCYIQSPLIQANTSFSASPNSKMLLRSTIGCCSWLHATISHRHPKPIIFFSKPSAMEMLLSSEQVAVTINIRRLPDLESFETSWRPANKRDYFQTPKMVT